MDGRTVDRGPAVLAGQFIIEGARQNARGRRLADAAHAGQQIGLMDAVEVEGVVQRAHHRLLADEVGEARGAIFAREHAIGGRRPRGLDRPASGRPRALRDGSAIGAARPSAIARGRSMILRDPRAIAPLRTLRATKVGGWTKTRPFSLGLLPSGPDPVGEWNVHRQPPGLYLAKDGLRRKGARRLSFRAPIILSRSPRPAVRLARVPGAAASRCPPRSQALQGDQRSVRRRTTGPVGQGRDLPGTASGANETAPFFDLRERSRRIERQGFEGDRRRMQAHRIGASHEEARNALRLKGSDRGRLDGHEKTRFVCLQVRQLVLQ